MTDFTRPADAAEFETWQASWRMRWEADYARTGSDPRSDRMIKRFTDSPDATVLRLLYEGRPVGFLAMSTAGDYGTTAAVLNDVFVEAAYRGRGLGTAAVRYAEDWARARADRIRARVNGVDPAQQALVRHWTLGGQGMVKELPDDQVALPDGVGVRPMAESEYPRWRAQLVQEYGQSFVDAGMLTSEEAAARAEEQTAALLPDGLATEGHEILVLLYHGEPAGRLWLRHGVEPGLSFVFDVEVRPEHRGKGLGRALMVAGEAASQAAGYKRLGLHVFGHNTVAIGLYDSLGYQIVEQTWSLSLS